ncbi:hypothetical protein ACVMGC_000966 [Bradyrhizobium barranii subsp. barranii]|uniref:hypothetical protein n=1 Tax=Bradyrhizobium TaxID=374 RepID=UPI001BA7D641|nr:MULTISPECIES: hypothetical protein [Bradyrhizobium]MBR0883890.1 hypothetical protein [Bradyrhizobium liaoningense]MCP1778882.1 hypothetical protein [Bradyrhizobium japonicum]MCP1958121.1 hypothetical protein [Bradyrhizobium japonicum]
MKARKKPEPLLHVHWVDRGYEPKHPPNPQYPDGVDVDLTGGDRLARNCKTSMPYPAKRVGYFVVTCGKCHFKTIITTAGRPDDPRSVRLPCKRRDA